MAKSEWFAVYYQTGGSINFRWKRAADVAGRENAQFAVSSLRNAGYPAHYDKRELVESIGLPDTYELAGMNPFVSPVQVKAGELFAHSRPCWDRDDADTYEGNT